MSTNSSPAYDVGNFLDTLDRHGRQFDVLDVSEARSLNVSVRDVRRRRGRLADDRDSGFRDIVLVELDGVLLWQTARDVVGTRGGGGLRRAGRRGWRRGLETATVLKELSVPVLEPNQYLAALKDTDLHLNPRCDDGLRLVRQKPNGRGFEATTADLKKTYAGRTLLLVHGTFSSSKNMLGEFAATEAGSKFLSDALTRYGGQVLVFDHPTLSVSPFLNALDLARRLAGTTGQVDVIAHSRGGLVVQWWLEVFGDTLTGTKVNAVLAGSPLKGTSLASPARIQPFISVLSNIGAFVGTSLSLAAAANPFAMASLALLKFLGRHERNRWGIPPMDDLGDRPKTDAAVAVIPGLQGQSGVLNNAELLRLRASLARPNVRYCALTANFEPEKMGWKLWQVITQFGDRAKDATTDSIFPSDNDLVVDTAHMTTLSDLADRPAITEIKAFPSSTTVHHCNYFRQPESIKSLRTWLDLPDGA